MAKAESGQPSLRLLRVGENIRHAISDALLRGSLHVDGLDSVSLTVSEVRCSPDLRHATVFVMPLGGDHLDAIDLLNRYAGRVAHEVGKRVRMKYTPRLHFRLDESFDEAGHINSLLNAPKVRQDLGKNTTQNAEGEEE